MINKILICAIIVVINVFFVWSGPIEVVEKGRDPELKFFKREENDDYIYLTTKVSMATENKTTHVINYEWITNGMEQYTQILIYLDHAVSLKEIYIFIQKKN